MAVKRTFLDVIIDSDEELGILDTGYIEDFYGVDDFLTLKHVDTGEEFSIIMANVDNGGPVPNDHLEGTRDATVMPLGDYEIRGRVVDVVGNVTILTTFQNPIGGEDIQSVLFTLTSDGVFAIMAFENLRDGIEALLIANQSTLYRTVTEQKQSTGAEEHKGNLRSIQVFFSEGDRDEKKSSRTQFEHNVTYEMFFTVAASSTADLSVLNNESATPSQKQAALLASTAGSRVADRLMDEFYRIITQIIMNPVNEDLGLAKYIVSNRVLANFRKNQPIDHGNLIVLTASAKLTAWVTEDTIGATPVVAVEPAIGIESNFNTKEDAEDTSPATVGVDINTT